MIDLEHLRRTIDAAPAQGNVATVTRGYLIQIERELREGRAAQARLAANETLTDVNAKIAGDRT